MVFEAQIQHYYHKWKNTPFFIFIPKNVNMYKDLGRIFIHTFYSIKKSLVGE